jgi:hypothetical protein
MNRGLFAPIFDGLETPIAMALASVMCETLGHVPPLHWYKRNWSNVSCECCLRQIEIRYDELVTSEWVVVE